MAKPSREYIYGINPCFEVLRAGRRTVYTAYLNEASPNHPRLKKLNAFLETKQVPVEWVGKERLFDLSRSKEHQGAVLKVRPYSYVDDDDLYESPRLLLLDNVEDPHNLGAILRCAEVFGFHHVLLPLRGTPEVYPSVVKVSAGASEHLSIARSHSANHYVKTAKMNGYVVAALDAKGPTHFDELRAASPEKLLLVIGGEAKSVGQHILNEADYVVGIPQHGRVNSLNASVAAGIAMHALAGD